MLDPLDLPLTPRRPTDRSFYHDVYEPEFLAGAKRTTLKEYVATLRHWRALTPNPPLGEIRSADLAEFKRALLEPTIVREQNADPQMLLFDPWASDRQRTLFGVGNGSPNRKPLSRATVNKHLRNLNAMLNKAGPRTPGNRDALGLLEVVPWTRPVKEPRRRPRPASEATVGPIYQATAAARFPDLAYVSAADWWKALIVAAYTTGCRRGSLLALLQADVEWEARQIRLEADDDKAGEERLKPISLLLMQHLFRIRTDHALMFPFPHSPTTWYRQWHRLQDAAGLRRESHIKFHQLKAACGTALARAGGSPWAIQQRLDHSTLRTSRFYINPSQEELEMIEHMPVPPAFFEDFPGLGPQAAGG